jgi:hypothetical protein
VPSIGDMVARIERLKSKRDATPAIGEDQSGQAYPPPAAPEPVTVPGLFRWECDASGQIGWVEGAPRGALIGRSLPGEEGAAIGFSVSAIVMFLVASSLTGFGKVGATSVHARSHLRFIGPLLLGQFILNLLFQADLQILGALARDAAVAAGKTPQDADELVGAYRAAQLFGFLPYQLLISVSFVLFPLLAKASHRLDGTKERSAMKIVVLVKEVPDTWGDRKLSLETGLADRGASETVLDEIGERALEVALSFADKHADAEVVVVSMSWSVSMTVTRIMYVPAS